MINGAEKDLRDDEPIRDGSNLQSFLYIVRRAHMELEGRDTMLTRFSQIKTKGHARQYLEETLPKLFAERERRRKRGNPSR
jgi:hypothetical protein